MLVSSPAEVLNYIPMSTTKKILALSFIFVCTTIAWAILGSTIFTRTYGLDDSLRSKVSSSWGTAQAQSPPTASWVKVSHEKQELTDAKGRTTTKVVELKEEIYVPLDSTRAQVALNLEHRQKGLL